MTRTPPRTVPVTEDTIPAELKAIDQWVNWKWKHLSDKNKWTKPPYQPNGRNAKSTDPATWTTFPRALAAYKAGRFDGIGFVLTDEDDYAGADLDHCVTEGTVDPWAMSIVTRFDSYAEISPSGHGVRIVCRGDLPPGRRKRDDREMYDSGRYLTITGATLNGSAITERQDTLEELHAEWFPPAEPDVDPGSTSDLSDAEILDLARNAANGAKFDACYRGDNSHTNDGTPSAGDLSLLSMLAFYTRGPVQLDRLFRGSGRMRAKWDRGDYRERTISQALETVTETYTGRTTGETEDPADDDAPPTANLTVVPVEGFAATIEPGADPLLGDTDDALIPEGGEVLVYGDGGAGKTTLAVDAVCHLAAGDVWLGITVKRPLQILLIENEGPRPLFRRKLDRKLAAWAGSPLSGRLHILEEPWAQFTFADAEHRQALAEVIKGLDLDVVVVGPITVAGMEEVGTIQDTRAFQALLADVRHRAGRRVTFILIHHQNKGGTVSGAWEGTGDTLLHVTNKGHGKTRLYIQKARWAPSYHATTINLAWADGEGYEVEEKEELDLAEVARMIVDYVTAHPGTGWTKVEEGTPGVSRQRRRDIRDQILAGGQIVNVAKIGGVETILDHVPEKKAAHLYRSDDPAIQHLRPDPGADGAQTAPPRGERDTAHLRPAPRRKEGAGAGAADHPNENLFDGDDQCPICGHPTDHYEECPDRY